MQYPTREVGFQATIKMPLTTIRAAPSLDSFTLLADHQSQTPASFFGAKPVLHYHAVGARAIVPWNEVSKLPIFAQSAEALASGTEDSGETVAGSAAEVVDAFISSEYYSSS